VIPDTYFLETELVQLITTRVLEHDTVKAERQYDFRRGLVGGEPPANDPRGRGEHGPRPRRAAESVRRALAAIAFLTLLTGAAHAEDDRDEWFEGFDLDRAAWKATDIVIARPTAVPHGFRVLETLQGTLPAGEKVSVACVVSVVPTFGMVSVTPAPCREPGCPRPATRRLEFAERLLRDGVARVPRARDGALARRPRALRGDRPRHEQRRRPRGARPRRALPASR